MMVQSIHDIGKVLFYLTKIHQHAAIVQIFPGYADLDFPIVAMQIFAFFPHHLQLMGCRKMSHNFQFVHF